MKYLINRDYYDPIRVGDKGDIYENDEQAVCSDCSAKYGEQHYAGCDCERCPLCHEQLISCGHEVIEMEEENEQQAE